MPILKFVPSDSEVCKGQKMEFLQSYWSLHRVIQKIIRQII